MYRTHDSHPGAPGCKTGDCHQTQTSGCSSCGGSPSRQTSSGTGKKLLAAAGLAAVVGYAATR